MAFEQIKNLLQETIGLYPGSIGHTSIERAIVSRMDSLVIKDETAYLDRLISDKEELEELVEEVVVPETWFFRNLIPFETLVKCIHEKQKQGSFDEDQIRILSVPCSTGEEPYSIAISLLKCGVKKESFQIDAVDISTRALKKARRAIYGKHSFRETDGVSDPNYFQTTRSGQMVLPYIKDHVNFIKGNILKDTISPAPEYYDIIFCRNLLIYFDRETQKKVLEKLNAILKKSGTLFMGHAETIDSGKNLFERLNIPRAFAYKKAEAGSLIEFSPAENTVNRLEDIYNQLVNVTIKDIELSRKHKSSSFRESGRPVKKTYSLKNANFFNVEKLIEQGQLSAASTLCEKLVEEEPEEAQGYYYLGLISNLEGNKGSADALLKKAIYLNPNHHKALGLSALLAEQRGDIAIAETMRFRELRAKKRIK